jgi:5-methylcytosine-specific restriction protein A
MSRNAEALIEQAGAYVRSFDRVSAGGRFDGCSSDLAIRLETEQELLDGTAALAKLARLVDAELTKRAGEIARRSEPRDDTSLARKMGAGSAANLVAQVAGVTRAAAGTMVASGEAFRPRENPFTGEALPAVFPHVAAAFADGLLDPDVAAAMRRALTKAVPGLTPFGVDELEKQVVASSQEGWTADELIAWLRKVPEHANPNAGAPRTDEPAPTQSVTRRLMDNGLFR